MTERMIATAKRGSCKNEGIGDRSQSLSKEIGKSSNQNRKRVTATGRLETHQGLHDGAALLGKDSLDRIRTAAMTPPKQGNYMIHLIEKLGFSEEAGASGEAGKQRNWEIWTRKMHHRSRLRGAAHPQRSGTGTRLSPG